MNDATHSLPAPLTSTATLVTSTTRSPPRAKPTTLLASMLATALLGSVTACIDDADGDELGEESEVITTVRLTFTPPGRDDPVTASFVDPDGDGGVSGSADPITLPSGTVFELSIELLNELDDPAEDITEEVRQEAEAHQLFITGDAVDGPATTSNPAAPLLHEYADAESRYGTNAVGDDLPVGLLNTITTRAPGSGTLRVMLRHLPELNGLPQKEPGLAESLAMGELLPGEVDAAVTFMVTVQ